MSEQPITSEARALEAFENSQLDFEIIRHGRVNSLQEAAQARGVAPADIIKTLVVRRAENDYLFVLVPGDREISWPKLRAHLDISRISMPDASVALAVTGFERGTITPFGSLTTLPVIADLTLSGSDERVVSIGAGGHGVAANINARAAIEYLGAEIADVTDPL